MRVRAIVITPPGTPTGQVLCMLARSWPVLRSLRAPAMPPVAVCVRAVFAQPSCSHWVPKRAAPLRTLSGRPLPMPAEAWPSEPLATALAQARDSRMGLFRPLRSLAQVSLEKGSAACAAAVAGGVGGHGRSSRCVCDAPCGRSRVGGRADCRQRPLVRP
jgi:hypothetical protein